MIERKLDLPILGLIGGTRAALGAGLGLLLADRLTVEQRHACGWTLFAIGALTTIPLAMEVLRPERALGHDGRHNTRVNLRAKRPARAHA